MARSGMFGRCSECRKTFEPAPSARSTQRVCGAACRRARERKLARSRRRSDIEDERGAERERQVACRKRRVASGCHAGPSAAKCRVSLVEMREIVDGALALSRGTLVRDLRGILGRYATDFGNGLAAVTRDPPLASAGYGC